MSGRSLKLIAIALSLATVVMASTSKDDTVSEIAGYRNWSRVTQKPILVEVASFAG